MMKTNQATAEYFTAFHAGMEAFETQDGFQEALDANPFAAGTKQYDAFIAGVREAGNLEAELHDEAELAELHDDFMDTVLVDIPEIA